MLVCLEIFNPKQARGGRIHPQTGPFLFCAEMVSGRKLYTNRLEFWIQTSPMGYPLLPW